MNLHRWLQGLTWLTNPLWYPRLHTSASKYPGRLISPLMFRKQSPHSTVMCTFHLPVIFSSLVVLTRDANFLVLDFTSQFAKLPTCPLSPVMKCNAKELPYYRGCWHDINHSFFAGSSLCDPEKRFYSKTFITFAIWLGHPFGHCPKFRTADPLRNLDRSQFQCDESYSHTR